jgi:hypothetical protein
VIASSGWRCITHATLFRRATSGSTRRDLRIPGPSKRRPRTQMQQPKTWPTMLGVYALVAWWLSMCQFRGTGSRVASWSFLGSSSPHVQALKFQTSSSNVACLLVQSITDLTLRHVNRWTTPPALQHAHHCGAADRSSLHCPRACPNMKSNSESLSIRPCHACLWGAKSRSDQLRDRHPLAMLRHFVNRDSFLVRRAVSGAIVSLVIIRAPRAARLLDLQ